MDKVRFIHSNYWVINAKRRQNLKLSGLTPGVKARHRAFTLVELLIVIAVVLLYGVCVVQKCAEGSAPLMTEPAPGYNGGFAGVGIKLAKDDPSNAVRISQIFPNSSAALARLSPGLVIEEIDGVTTQGKSMVECQMRIRGQAGTKVRLKLVNSYNHETRIVELTREALMTSNITVGLKHTFIV